MYLYFVSGWRPVGRGYWNVTACDIRAVSIYIEWFAEDWSKGMNYLSWGEKDYVYQGPSYGRRLSLASMDSYRSLCMQIFSPRVKYIFFRFLCWLSIACYYKLGLSRVSILSWLSSRVVILIIVYTVFLCFSMTSLLLTGRLHGCMVAWVLVHAGSSFGECLFVLLSANIRLIDIANLLLTYRYFYRN